MQNRPKFGETPRGNTEPRRGVTPEGVETRRVETHICVVCEIAKDSSEFYAKDRTGRRSTKCKRCQIIYQREKALGITQEQYLAIHQQQGGRCGICSKRCRSRRYKAFAVDHDHATGRIRGLLCGSCNMGLGIFQDREELLLRAIAWVKV